MAKACPIGSALAARHLPSHHHGCRKFRRAWRIKGVRLGGFGNIARAFANRNYRVYATGNAISLTGTWLQRVAIGWLAWQLAHSGTWLGLVSFADLFPTVVLSPLAGAIADRFERVRVIWLSQSIATAQAFALAILAYLDALDILGLFALAVLMGIANAINQPARLALIPDLVERASLASAVAINSLIFNGARFIGPAIAGFVIAEGNVALAFAINAVSYAAFAVALARLDLARNEARPVEHKIFRSMVEGYLYAARHRGIGAMLLLMAVTSLGTRGFIEMLPGFADTVFGRGPQAFAAMTATVGLGAIVGGLWMVRRPAVEGLTAIVFANSLLMCGAILGFTATASFWVALPCLWLAGFGLVVSGIGAQTLVQSAVDTRMRGRVMALYGMIFRGGPALGAVVTGTLSAHFGLRAPVAAGAILCGFYWLWARLGQNAVARQLETLPESAE
ncbi:MAG: MFS transporter [Alphaproteobacteria bacterium]|nr:MFS transporter [Alphaproteobacteria bacterium]